MVCGHDFFLEYVQYRQKSVGLFWIYEENIGKCYKSVKFSLLEWTACDKIKTFIGGDFLWDEENTSARTAMW